LTIRNIVFCDNGGASDVLHFSGTVLQNTDILFTHVFRPTIYRSAKCTTMYSIWYRPTTGAIKIIFNDNERMWRSDVAARL